jgi:3-methyl-2-oxobutanoate hydroxymethyltransferase
MQAVTSLMQSGAQAVKLEGVKGNIKLIKHLVASGIPVMGHIGLTPQSVCLLGYRVQGKSRLAAEQIQEAALLLQAAGCFAVVLECIPSPLAKTITDALQIPTIGIGAGPHTDGQVLVWQDVLGLNVDFKPKFVKSFLNGQTQITESLAAFVAAVKTGEFPSDEHCYYSE